MDKILLEELIAKKLTAPQIGKQLNKSEWQVRRAIKKYGLKLFRHIEKDNESKLKICRYCNLERNNEDFPTAGIIDGKQYYRNKCNVCYEKTKGNRRKSICVWLNELKKDLSCQHCKNNDYRVIEFHHKDDDKDFSISFAISKGFSKEKILKEIEKCIPLCGNCHRILHHEERNQPTNLRGDYEAL